MPESKTSEKRLSEAARQTQALELRKAGVGFEVIAQKALSGDLECIDRALKIEARRAKLLGLDAPEKVDIEWRIRLMARSLGLDEDAAVAEAEREIRHHAGRHATTL
jgi:hypothetical protein